MSLILSGTDGLSDVDGSAATPAIRGTDANTGIFFPAADVTAISTGGTERMRIDSSGNVGIGTSSPAYRLDVSGNARASNYYVPAQASGGGFIFEASGNTGVSIGQTSNTLQFYTTGAEAMRISSGQQVGIGKSPAVTLDVNGAINYDPNVTVNGLSVVSRATYNDNVNRALGASWNNTFGVITIKGTGGATNIPFFSNGGSGIGFTCTTLDPDAGTWSYGSAVTISWTTAGTGGNTFVLAFLGGSGTFELQRTSGSGSFTVVIQHYTT